MIRDIQDEIVRLKKEKNICILAHSYQSEAVCEIADYTGDSYALARKAAEDKRPTALMCGVRFMAEGVKLLCPQKKVILSHPEAGCPMAEQFGPFEVEAFRKENPGVAVVAYINTSAELKTVCDVCVTSSSAVDIVRKMHEKDILFIPDCNLGEYVASKVPEKNIITWMGGCPVHARVSQWQVKQAKAAHPNALVLVHPECTGEVRELADMIGSTSAIMDYAKNSDHKEFIIGTENSIVEHLKAACPDKSFYPMWKEFLCPNMKLTTLYDVLACLKGQGGEIIDIDCDMAAKARRCLDRMLEM